MTRTKLDWNDVAEAARQMAGNWRLFDAFVWGRGYRLNDANYWMIGYTSHRDAGVLAQSNLAFPTNEEKPPQRVRESSTMSHWPP